MSFPTVSFDKLWHVGSLDPDLKGIESYEGAGLSVSEYPEEWAEIARLGDETWEATRPDNKFLDFLATTDAEREEIVVWGIGEGYIDLGTTYRVHYFDAEDETMRRIDFEDFAIAEAEYEDMEENEVDDLLLERIEATPVPTRKLLERTGIRDAPADLDLLATLFAEDVLDIDGVWWDEALDVLRLSAPRAVIVPSRIADWDFEAVP